MSFKQNTALLLSFCFLLTAGCATHLSQNRYAAADRTAAATGFQKSSIRTSSFTLTAYVRMKNPGDPLHVYIEGDGTAWLSRTRLSDDPTPKNTLVLELAALDPATNVAYLARPGQYGAQGRPDCEAAYWSGKRFSAEVVEAMNESVEVLRERAKAEKIHLIGYSGGAAVASLIAARHRDVASLRTVAGNLDPEAVNRLHKVSPLNDSLNPLDVAEKLRPLPQRHFIGSQDQTVPPEIAASFLKRQGRRNLDTITIVPGATHTSGWLERWPQLLRLPPI